MKKTTIKLPEITLVGITCRTNNTSEMDLHSAKIPSTITKYFGQSLSEKILYRKNPRTTYCVYTDYESDFTGNYTYLIGEEVSSVNNLPEGFLTTTIPPQHYSKFTNEPGLMPIVCIDMWRKIWKMESEELGGKRLYLADFEVYDERALDHSNSVLDIYIGVKI